MPLEAPLSRLLFFACALWCLTPVHAQEPHRDLPSNAHFSSGEQGWACDRGFTQVSGLCIEDSDVLPSESAFEFFDGQWRCRPGYHRAGRFCVPGVAPAHAAFVGDGNRWECDWGFQKVGSQCQEVKPPPHAYLEASGHDWVCYPGYGRVSDHCVPRSSPAPTDAPTPTTTSPGQQTPKR